MEDNKISGAKNALQTMLFYYLYSLIDNVEDPKQYIATELGKMINLSEEQIQYVKLDVATNNLLENLSYSISLLEHIEKTGKLDIQSIKIVKDILKILMERSKDVLKDTKEIDNNV